ncbi:MAG: hypothetical protein UHH95_02645 [Oscillospiraceae bacterium]|nr:hypothetical protein [Oscillospiraceae bacterium]
MVASKFPRSKNESNLGCALRIMLSMGACLCFAVFFILGPMKILSSQALANSICILLVSIALIIFCAVFFTRCLKLSSEVIFASALAVSAAALALRLYFFNQASGDYNSFLSVWLSHMRALSGTAPITTPIGDYNMPYLYFLFGISRTELYDLYLIKLLSVIFDFILAAGVCALANHFCKSEAVCLVAFSLSLFVPTVFLNSAFWGQCDGIYAALLIWALYFALTSKPRASIVFFALSFSFKIQAIFMLPIIIFLVLKNKINLKQLIYFPLTFVLTLLPAILCGRSFYDTFSIYFEQTSSYPSLTLNCPTLWALFPDDRFDTFGSAALFLAGAGVLVFCIYLYQNRAKLSDTLLFDAAYLFTLLIPFLLPRMHERYFYLAEVLTVVYILLHRNRLYASLIVVFTGFSCYCAYLFGYSFFSLAELSIANGAAIIYIFKKFTDDISAQKSIAAPQSNKTEESL